MTIMDLDSSHYVVLMELIEERNILNMAKFISSPVG
jgi:hypothetical protein